MNNDLYEIGFVILCISISIIVHMIKKQKQKNV